MGRGDTVKKVALGVAQHLAEEKAKDVLRGRADAPDASQLKERQQQRAELYGRERAKFDAANAARKEQRQAQEQLAMDKFQGGRTAKAASDALRFAENKQNASASLRHAVDIAPAVLTEHESHPIAPGQALATLVRAQSSAERAKVRSKGLSLE